MEAEKILMVRVSIEHDGDTESPLEWTDYKLVSFIQDYNNYEDPYLYVSRNDPGRGIVAKTGGLARKLAAGTAWWLSCYRHSDTTWSIRGEGVQDRWDTTFLAGILLWNGKPKELGPSKEKRTEHARGILETYNNWINGACFWYKVEKALVAPDHEVREDEWEEVGSCGGFIGEDMVVQGIRGCLGQHNLVDAMMEFNGDCMWVAEDVEFKASAPV